MQHNIILPDFGQTTAEAKIVQFLKSSGQPVKRGEPVLLVSTDKAEVEVESFEDGYLREWLVQEGDLTSALAAVAILTSSPDERYDPPGPSPVSRNGPSTANDALGGRDGSSDTIQKVAVAPAARELAKRLGIDVRGIKGSGVGGLVTKADVESRGKELESGGVQFSAMAAVTLASKKEIPHFYVTRDAELTRAELWRKSWNDLPANPHVTWNDIFVHCSAKVLTMDGILGAGRGCTQSGSDLLIIAAREPGLVFLPLPNPSGLPWVDLLRALRDSKPSSYPAGFKPVLAISNLGMFGVKQFAAIIPPGCRAVLAIGTVRRRVVIKQDRITVEPVCNLTLSADHRVVDGVAAARFLEEMQRVLDEL